MEGAARMRSFTLTRDFRGRSITAAVTDTGQGVQVLLSGGDAPHIGAVGVLSPDGKIAVTEFSAHREGVLCRQWCRAFWNAGIAPAAVSAGVHYDAAAAAEIQRVVALCESLLKETIRKLKTGEEPQPSLHF